MQVITTSHLYKSIPMHVLDQPEFINAAAWVQTNLTAMELLPVLKSIEADAGRTLDAQRWGPRPLDMDIIFFDNQQIKTDTLTVPHPRWHERAFVCRPVSDLIDSKNSSLPQVRSPQYIAEALTTCDLHCADVQSSILAVARHMARCEAQVVAVS